MKFLLYLILKINFLKKRVLKLPFIGHPISTIINHDYDENKEEKDLIAFLLGSRENEINKLYPYFKNIHDYLLSNKYYNKYKIIYTNSTPPN